MLKLLEIKVKIKFKSVIFRRILYKKKDKQKN